MNLTIICTHPVEQIPGLQQWLRRVITGVKNIDRESVEVNLIEGPGQEKIGRMCAALGANAVVLRTAGKMPLTDFSFYNALVFLPEDKRDDFIKSADLVLAFDKCDLALGEKLALLETAPPKNVQRDAATHVNAQDVVNNHKQRDASVEKPYANLDWVADYQDNCKKEVDPYFQRTIPDEVRDTMAPKRQDPFYNE